jgi:hypothetical protein
MSPTEWGMNKDIIIVYKIELGDSLNPVQVHFKQ